MTKIIFLITEKNAFESKKNEQKLSVSNYPSELKKVDKIAFFSLTKPYKTAILFYVLKR